MGATLPVDTQQLQTLGQSIYNTILGFLVNAGVPQWLAQPVAGTLAGVVMLIPAFFVVLVQGILGVGTFFATSILTTIGNVRQTNAQDFNAVIAASLSELLGVEISPDSLPGGQGPNGITERMRAIGGTLHDLLISEMGGLRPVNPSDGANNAKAFSGFAINFATASAFIAILTECESFGFLKEFRELGVETAEALGLGRLQRLAMQPLIQNLIQKPYNYYLQAQTRPTRLAESQLIKAYRHGDIQLDDLNTRLAELGYRDEDIPLLIADLTSHVAATELETLIRYNIIKRDEAIARLTASGLDATSADYALQAVENQRADSQVSALLTDLASAYTDGFVDEATYNNVLQGLPLTDEEETLFRTRVGFKQDRARKTVTLAQLQTAIVDGIADFTYMDTWMQRQGYNDEDQLILTYETLQKLKDATAKETAKQYKAAQLRAKGKPVPPWLQG